MKKKSEEEARFNLTNVDICSIMVYMGSKKTRIQGFMTVKEAAEYLGVNPITLRRWDKKGKLKTRRHPMNNFRIYTKEEVERIKKLIEGGD